MIINHNISAMDANRNLGLNAAGQARRMEKLSSGERINRAADDAAGLAISERMRGQIRGTHQAIRNINDGVSFIQTAEGYLSGVGESLLRIRELSIQAANGTVTPSDREYIQEEVNQMVDEVNRIASQAQFNGATLFTGRFDADNGGEALVIHMGANMDQSESFNVGNMTAASLQIEGVSLLDAASANQAIGTMDGALDIINSQRANLGAAQNRLEKASVSQGIGVQNLQAAESQIRDADMAAEMVELTKETILVQSATAMEAQANQKTQGVLRLLG